ncbi:MAG: type 1 glutamine amidotransferase [Abitibacteriaceae bacterium]|nr:type 1 glutamine amidotransferase [Abditibacteriaceae bacterium]
MERQLKGRRIAALVADGFEQVELTIPMYALRLAGAQVEIISLRHGRIRGVNLHEPARRVGVDKTVEEADPNAYDALLLPGGFINPDLLRQSQRAREFVRAFDTAGKPIASLCHGPWVLASAGLLQGRTLTSWPGVRDDLVNAGATWLDQEVVRDGNLVTSRGPQDLKPFVQEVLRHFAAGAPMQQGGASAIGAGVTASGATASGATASVSSPQLNEPPQVVLEAMRWLPRPSVRDMALIALGVALFAPQLTKKCFGGG